MSKVPRSFFFPWQSQQAYKLYINRHDCLFLCVHVSVSRVRWFSPSRSSDNSLGFLFCPSASPHTRHYPCFLQRSADNSKAVVRVCHPNGRMYATEKRDRLVLHRPMQESAQAPETSPTALEHWKSSIPSSVSISSCIKELLLSILLHANCPPP